MGKAQGKAQGKAKGKAKPTAKDEVIHAADPTAQYLDVKDAPQSVARNRVYTKAHYIEKKCRLEMGRDKER
eukprot:5956073-Pyramimonas_sp.AAC.1